MKSSERLYLRLPVFMQNMICTGYGYGARRLRYSGVFEESLRQLNESQWWSADRLIDHQNGRLRETIRSAYENVPFYRKRFSDCGATPEDITTVDDLKKLPVLTKAQVFDAGNAMVDPSMKRSQLVSYSTSGTTGSALQVWRTRACEQYQWAVCWRHRGRFGVTNKSRVASFTWRVLAPHSQNRPPFWRYNRAFNQTVFSQYHMKPEFLSSYVNQLDSMPYECFTGYPSVLYLLASYLRDSGRVLKQRPKVVFVSSETLLDEQKEMIEQYIAKTSALYGCLEYAGAASQCEHGYYHVDTEFCAIEIVPIEGVVQKPGEITGRVLMTGFADEAMPFIRYDVGDIATELPGFQCPCGRKSMVLKDIDGRIESYITTADGRRVGRLGSIFKTTGWIREVQILQHRVGAIDIKIVERRPHTESDIRSLLQGCRARLGNDMEIAIHYVDSIQRCANGKLRAVVSTLRTDDT